MRLVFMGSPEEVISPLQTLLEHQKKLGFELVSVVSQPARPAGRKRVLTDPPVAKFAKENGLTVHQPEKASAQDFLETLKTEAPDVIITAAYGQMLSEAFLDIPKRAVINIHPSLLPEYRGATPVQAALLDGKKTTGVSVLFTVKKMDAGAIIEQEEYQISAREKANDLLNTLFEIGGRMTLSALEKLKDSSFKGREQDLDKVTFCKKFLKQDALIDFKQSAESLCNRFRAFYPWPGFYTFCQGERVVIEDTEWRAGQPDQQIGSFYLEGDQLKTACKDGFLEIKSLKPAGAKSMSARAYFERLKAKNWIAKFSSEDIS